MEKMLAAVFHKGNKIGGEIKLEEVDIPQITKSDQVLVEIKACGICHEFVGIIKEIGEGVKDLKVGDKVVVDPNEKCGYCINCRRGLTNLCEYMALGTTFGIFQHGGFAKFCVLPRSTLFKLPNNIDFTAAALIEPLSCGC